ncbi:MAG: cytochrome c biogenesis protein CcsA [Nitrospirae bacterium]|nr:cytochrome c biogenesis protein CcsA [Nitrospirota bacterium]
MINLFAMLAFIVLYSFSLAGGKHGRLFFIFGLLLHSGYIIYRAFHLGWPPVTERHDILLLMAAGVAYSFFYFQKKASHGMLLEILPLFVIIFSFFAVFQARFDTIDPNMRSKWFFIHIAFLIAGYALFAAGSAAGILYLKTRSALYETMQYRLTLYGWLFFSFSLIGGSVWFFLAYGVYWLWTAKELWITIVWFYFSFYLHGRIFRPFAGRPAALIGIGGFPVMIFSYLGVMPILGSPWTQF